MLANFIITIIITAIRYFKAATILIMYVLSKNLITKSKVKYHFL